MYECVATVDFRKIPIPCLKPSCGWKEVPIHDCEEPLVCLNTYAPDLIVVDAQYHQQHLPFASDAQYARQGIAEQLVSAAKMLSTGLRVQIWDAWRPLEVQQALFDEYQERLARQHPDWGIDQLLLETQTYVSLPSRNPARPSPHNTGAAIDLTICDFRGRPLPMGVSFDFFGPESATSYYELKDSLTIKERVFRNNRRLLYHTMTNAGFTGYDEEIWHFDLGNQFDAVRKGTHAIYGAVSPLELTS